MSSFRPATHSAIRRLSWSLSSAAAVRIEPVVMTSRMRSGVICLSTAVRGAWCPGSLLSWHEAQFVKYWLTPALSDCAKALVVERTDANTNAIRARYTSVFMSCAYFVV